MKYGARFQFVTFRLIVGQGIQTSFLFRAYFTRSTLIFKSRLSHFLYLCHIYVYSLFFP